MGPRGLFCAGLHAPILRNDVSVARVARTKRFARRERIYRVDQPYTRKQRTGVRGEVYAYWYLGKLGYVFVAKNYKPRGGAKGELDLVGYDGETLAFVEVRTRTVGEQLTALLELSVNPYKQHVVARTARRFLAERHAKDIPLRFDVLAIDNIPGSPPESACIKTLSVLKSDALFLSAFKIRKEKQ